MARAEPDLSQAPRSPSRASKSVTEAQPSGRVLRLFQTHYRELKSGSKGLVLHLGTPTSEAGCIWSGRWLWLTVAPWVTGLSPLWCFLHAVGITGATWDGQFSQGSHPQNVFRMYIPLAPLSTLCLLRMYFHTLDVVKCEDCLCSIPPSTT